LFQNRDIELFTLLKQGDALGRNGIANHYIHHDKGRILGKAGRQVK
jgi:hypothetical protein